MIPRSLGRTVRRIARLLYPQESETIQELRRQLADVQTELAALKLENKFLGFTNEHALHWLKVSTAAAIDAQRILGVPGK